MTDDVSQWTDDVHCGDSKDVLADMPADSVHMAMTSPPYYGLRNYEVDGQIGLEESLEDYIQNLVSVFDELKRVLRPDGSFWLNLGDSYSSGGKKTGGSDEFQSKQKMLVPSRVAIALQQDGWILRNDVTWYKPNPMPESVTDRLSTKTEKVFHLAPEPDYWYDLDAIRPPTGGSVEDGQNVDMHPNGKNPGDVFEVTTKSFSDAHFACVSDDTEILTKSGWKTHDELCRGEKVATYDTDADCVELEPVSSVNTYDVDTELLHVGNRDLDILMTEDHRNVTKHSRTGEVRVRRGYDLAGRDEILVHAPSEWETNGGVGEPLAELLGWVIAEGNYREYGGVRIYQQEGDDADRIRDLLDRLGVPHTERTRRGDEVEWSIPVGTWADVIRSLAPEKRLTEFLASMPEPDIQALFDGLVGGGGHVREDDGRVSFTEKTAETRDWFQVIAFRLGYHAIDGTKDVHCTERRSIGIRGTNGDGLNVERVDYDGVVWCPKTPNGTWVARRNGRPFITGNTYPPELCEKPIKSTCPPEVCAACGTPYERVVEEERSNYGTSDHPERTGGAIDGGTGKNFPDVKRDFQGWEPACDCDTDATEPGIALDPFTGSGTTCMVARQLGRRFVGMDLNEEYVAMAQKRIGMPVSNPEHVRDEGQSGVDAFLGGGRVAVRCPRCDSRDVRCVYVEGEPPQDRCADCGATVVTDGGRPVTRIHVRGKTFSLVRRRQNRRGSAAREVTAVNDDKETPTDEPDESDVEQNVPSEIGGGDAVSEVVRRETGVRLRTNVQAGGASERVNITLETHAQSLADLVTKADTHERVLAEQVEHARAEARRNND